MIELASNFIKSVLEDFGLIEWLLFWGFLLLTPFFLFYEGLKHFRKKEKKASVAGTRRVIEGLAWLSCVALLLIFFWRPLITMTVAGAGSWIIGFLIIAAVCLVAFPISLAGSKLRQAYEYQKHNYPAAIKNKSLALGTLGIIASAVVGLSLYYFIDDRAALVFSGIAVVAIGAGWFGNILVPEV